MITAVAMQEFQIMEPSSRNGKEHASLRVLQPVETVEKRVLATTRKA
ncbi:hypothetical protein [Sphingomonas sp. BK481]|nr:hypothetical protein [Sphingomonas sp. BK481]MBB3588181.1 hypothetical protein [Sphingomonas sp. BK481]